LFRVEKARLRPSLKKVAPSGVMLSTNGMYVFLRNSGAAGAGKLFAAFFSGEAPLEEKVTMFIVSAWVRELITALAASLSKSIRFSFTMDPDWSSTRITFFPGAAV
jgi:hypothetical protein